MSGGRKIVRVGIATIFGAPTAYFIFSYLYTWKQASSQASSWLGTCLNGSLNTS